MWGNNAEKHPENLLPSARVLLVEDETRRLNGVRQALVGAGARNIAPLEDPDFLKEALTGFEPHLLILDWFRADASLLRIMREVNVHAGQRVRMLVISSVVSREIRRTAFSFGAAAVLDASSSTPAGIVNSVTTLLKQATLLEERLNELPFTRDTLPCEASNSIFGEVQQLKKYIRRTDPTLGVHSHRVATLSRLLAQQMGLNHAEVLHEATYLHDLGKIAIPQKILTKSAALSAADVELIALHPIVGAHLLSARTSTVLRLAETIALTHHEWWNGAGYPRGLRGEEVPLEGRIVAVADAFDAMTSARPYRPTLTTHEAIEELQWRAGTQFDPAIVDEFLKLNHIQPAGCQPNHAAGLK